MSYNILIVDDSALIRHALRSCIEQTRDWQVCGEADNGKVAVEKVKQLHPDVVILNLQMPVMDGLEAAGQINLLAPNTAMLMFTMHNCEQLLRYAPAAGIRDVLSKSDGLAERLLASLKKLHVERGNHLLMRASR
ncbi:MAG TPA: response regulator [Terriglobales bacterium]|nr:response regulator [Terriglobales bacterium]